MLPGTSPGDLDFEPPGNGRGHNIGDVIHISDITLPEGVQPVIHRNFVVANIAAPSGLRSAEAGEGEEEAASA